MRPGRLPRELHPVAWWLWAVALAVAVGQTTNPILLALALAVLALVVSLRRTEAPWARGFKYYLALALTVVAVRVVFRSLFGGDVGGPGSQVLLRIPHITLPSWAAGVQLGGPVTVEGTLSALYGGVRLAALLCCLGAANVLANPKRALRSLPGALSELGVAAVVAFNVGPQLIESSQRVRRAAKLRGDRPRRRHLIRSTVIPVVEEAFERSLRLASSMDARGFGRVERVDPRHRRQARIALLGGLLVLCLGMYGLLDASSPSFTGLPAVLAGSALCVGGLALGGRDVRRTRYRPDPWSWPESVVVATGLVPVGAFLWAAHADPLAMNPPFNPVTWPALPLLPAAALLVAALAAVAAPPPPRPGPAGRRAGAVVGAAPEPFPPPSRRTGREPPPAPTPSPAGTCAPAPAPTPSPAGTPTPSRVGNPAPPPADLEVRT